MPNTTLEAPDPMVEEAAESLRLGALRRVFAPLPEAPQPPEERYFDAACQTLVDAVLARDEATLAGAADYLRSFQSHWRSCAQEDPTWAEALGRLRGLISLAFSGAERLPSARVVNLVAPRSRAHRFLTALDDVPTLQTQEVAAATGLDATAISRVAKELTSNGLLLRTKVGKACFYEITPHGRQALRTANGRGAPVSPLEPSTELTVAPGSSSLLVESSTFRPFTVESAELKLAQTRAHDSEERTRLRFLSLVTDREPELTRRLLSWDAVGNFVVDEQITYAVPPLKASTAQWRSSTSTAFQHVDHDLRLKSFWPVAPPAFDGFAFVQGAAGKTGIVLIEAKSTPDEFQRGQVRTSVDERRVQVDRALGATGKYAGAGGRWKASTTNYLDPASRLALLYYLREHDVAAWLLNVYFVRPESGSDVRNDDGLPSPVDWWNTIRTVRADLKLVDDHRLSGLVKQEFVSFPSVPDVDPALPARR